MSSLAPAVRKIVTLPSAWFGAAVALGVCVVVVSLVRASYPTATTDAVLTLAWTLVQAAPVAVGAVLGSHEYRGGQHRTSVLATPRRSWLMMARWLAGAGACCALGLAVAVVGRLALGLAALDSGVAPVAVWLAAGAWAAWLVADTTRSALAGVASVLAVVWILPALLRGSAPDLARLLPDDAATSLLEGAWPGSVPWAALVWLAACAMASACAAFREA